MDVDIFILNINDVEISLIFERISLEVCDINIPILLSLSHRQILQQNFEFQFSSCKKLRNFQGAAAGLQPHVSLSEIVIV